MNNALKEKQFNSQISRCDFFLENLSKNTWVFGTNVMTPKLSKSFPSSRLNDTR